jgi:hypothetical protein
VKGRPWGLVGFAVAIAVTVPARAQTEPGAPEISVDGAQVQAAPAPGLPSTPASPSAPAPRLPSPADTALERVLRSGCRDGLAEVISERASANEGRGRLVLWSSLYGIWLGIAGDILMDVNDLQPAVLLPMVGIGVGLGASVLITSHHPVTTGQAWTIITGLDYGSVNGALWGAGLGLSARGVVGLSLATSVAATSVAIYVAATESPKAGDIELVRSSLLWGTTAGLLATAAFSSSNTTAESAWRAGAIAMDVALAAGIGMANSFDLSRNRVLIIDAGALGGGLVGLGVALLVSGNNNVSGQSVAAGALGSLVAGITIAALATGGLDTPETQARAPAYPALLARDADGHWSVGMPAPTPVLDTTGTRAVGASLSALGGLF